MSLKKDFVHEGAILHTKVPLALALTPASSSSYSTDALSSLVHAPSLSFDPVAPTSALTPFLS